MSKPAPEGESTMSATGISFWQTSFERHGSAVLAFLTSRLGSRAAAEDLLQETFVRAMRTATPLRDVDKVRSYLFSTAYRLILNRGRKRRPLLFSELSGEQSRAAAVGAARGDAAPEELADLELLRRRLARVLDHMPAAHRRAFEAAVLEEKSYGEIAGEEGWTLDQVRMNVYRGRKRVIADLRDLLGVREDS